MKNTTKRKTKENHYSEIVKFPTTPLQHAWLQQQAGRGNVAEFVRSKVFGSDYSRNTLPAARYRWELAVALSWVGNNLQRLTEKIDDLSKILEAKQPRETELIAFSGIVQLLKVCAETLRQISKSLGEGGVK